MKKKKILLVDDELVFVRAMKNILSKDFEVITATDGEKCLELAKEASPDLILLDILMPGMNGLVVLKILKENEETKHIPVALLTNLEDNQAVAEGVALGAKGYLVKADYNIESILKKIKTLVV